MKLITPYIEGKNRDTLWAPRPTQWSPLVLSTSRFYTEEIVGFWTLIIGTSVGPGPYFERYVRGDVYKSVRKELETDKYGYRSR